MQDLLCALQKSLQPIFTLEGPTWRNGRYTHQATQELQLKLNTYINHATPKHFQELTKSIKKALPEISRRRSVIAFDFESIKAAMNDLAEVHELPTILWKKTTNKSRLHPSSFFSNGNTQPAQEDFLSWLGQ